MNKKFQNVQALRGLAAGAVVVSHLGAIGPAFPHLPTKLGVMGVDVFFVLSGFIMCYVTKQTWGSTRLFLLRRAERIYPLWWMSLIAASPWILKYVMEPVDEYFAYVAHSWLLLPSVSPRGELYPLLSVGWTLTYEVAFYVIFASLMLFDRRQIGWKLLAVFCASYAIGTTLQQSTAASLFLTNAVYFEFALGVFIAEALTENRLHRGVIASACSIALLVCIAAWIFDLSPTGKMRFLILGSLASATLMLTLALEDAGLLAPRSIVFLGEASYALYLTHTIVITYAAPLVSGWFGLPPASE